jgi:hypothetical protein
MLPSSSVVAKWPMHLCDLLPFFRSRNIERMRTKPPLETSFQPTPKDPSKKMMDYLHYCWTHATTNPDHTSKSCSTSKLTCWTPPSPISGRQLHSASLAGKWKKRAQERNGRNGRGAANQARDNEQEPAANQAPPAPNGQSMPQWPTPPQNN